MCSKLLAETTHGQPALIRGSWSAKAHEQDALGFRSWEAKGTMLDKQTWRQEGTGQGELGEAPTRERKGISGAEEMVW